MRGRLRSATSRGAWLLAPASLLLCAAALLPGAGARGKRKGRKHASAAPAGAAGASYAILGALERARAKDEAGARQQATAALTQYRIQAEGRENLVPILSKAEQLLGLELALQHVVLPVMETPDQTVAKLKTNDNIWHHLDKGPHAGFLLNVAKAGAAQAPEAADLSGLKLLQLVELARTSGVGEDTLDASMETDDPKTALIDLIGAHNGQTDARSQALRRGLDGLRAYKSREYETGRKLLLEAIELRGAAVADNLLLLLYWQEKRCGFELAVTFFLIPFLGLSDKTLSFVTEQWVAAEDKSPWAQSVRQLARFPGIQQRAEDDLFLTPYNMELKDRTLMAGRPAALPNAGYAAVAKDDDTGVRSIAFHANQYRYLLDNGLISPEHEETWRGYVTMKEAMEGPDVQTVMQYGQEKKAVGFIVPEIRENYGFPAMPTAFGRVNYRRKPPAALLDSTSLHPRMLDSTQNLDAIQMQFEANNGIAVADDVLTPDVVDELWRFCVESTVYFATKKGGIYMGGCE
jgi:hypothetical protein